MHLNGYKLTQLEKDSLVEYIRCTRYRVLEDTLVAPTYSYVVGLVVSVASRLGLLHRATPSAFPRFQYGILKY